MSEPSAVPALRTAFSVERIDAEVRRMAAEITTDYAGMSLHVVVVLTGAFVFAADLVRHIDLPMSLDFVRISSYRGTRSTGGINLALGHEVGLRGRDVLVVEDILDTGLSLDYLLRSLASEEPRTLRSCVLITKSVTRTVAVDPEYRGFSWQGGFLVGYGLDYDGRFRNLPALYEMG